MYSFGVDWDFWLDHRATLDSSIGNMQHFTGYGRVVVRKQKYIYSLLVVLVLVAILTSMHWFTVVRVSGSSMEPSLNDGSYVIVQKNAELQRGDIVLIRTSNRTYIVKRIVGIGGDNVLIRNDSLHVNHVKMDSLTNHLNAEYQFEVNVPDGTVFVLGDNRLESTDSRDFGCSFA